jgi:hypothetical protein
LANTRLSPSAMTRRQDELDNVKDTSHIHWLAGELDHVEETILGRMTDLAVTLDENTSQVAQNNKEQASTRQRMTWLALTTSLTILVGVIVASITAIAIT